MADSSLARTGLRFPLWAARTLCPANLRCRDGECEMLHLPESEAAPSRASLAAAAAAASIAGEEQQDINSTGGDRPRLVVCAGPERSGSTWLFNAVRLLLHRGSNLVLPYWIHSLSLQQLQERGFTPPAAPASAPASALLQQPQGTARGTPPEEDGPFLRSRLHLVVKTHEWSFDWDPAVADAILVMDRDPLEVVQSYVRMGWLPPDPEIIESRMLPWMEDHSRWCQVASLVLPYSEIGGHKEGQVKWILEIARSLQLSISEEDAGQIAAEVDALAVPSHGGPDPVSKLWPRHRGSRKVAVLTENQTAAIRSRLNGTI